jgi:transglutaminase/protease-like cytokinesis protein 3
VFNKFPDLHSNAARKTILNFKASCGRESLLNHIIFIPLSFYSQSKQDNFYQIDNEVGYVPVSNTDTLAKQLAALGNTDKEKVRAIFRWITENIEYNVRPIGRKKNTPALFYEEPDDSSKALPSLNERVAAKVLYKGVAFCEGYSRLFKTLCDHAGIKAEIIYGYARTNNNRRFGVNHTWNAVYIDGTWHLLDVTWASGFVTLRMNTSGSTTIFIFLLHLSSSSVIIIRKISSGPC